MVVIIGINRGYIYIWICKVGLGLPKIQGTLFGGPYKKDSSILRSMLGPPIQGNPYTFEEHIPAKGRTPRAVFCLGFPTYSQL